MRLDVEVSVPVSTSYRANALEAMFDVPHTDRSTKSWTGELPIEDRDWSVGLIVGPSGAGKSTIAAKTWGTPRELEWAGDSVVDDFAEGLSMQDIAAGCQAVGFNTIPSWLRPYRVLSTGERFRVELARRLLEHSGPVPLVVDEFTSVVDRQVAQIGSHAVQKYVRRHPGMRFVAVTCHYDVLDWLQPDWVLEPATMSFAWRSVQPRPGLDVTISPVPYATWRLFAPFHYLTAELHRAARCWCLFVGDEPAAFAGVIPRPHPSAKNIYGLSRLVTLPDWQGLGLAFVLTDTVAGLYKAVGRRFRSYPAHPALVRSFDRSTMWRLEKQPGQYANAISPTSRFRHRESVAWHMGGRPCAVFEYVGPAHADQAEAAHLFTGFQLFVRK